jgi:hypothetical protein
MEPDMRKKNLFVSAFCLSFLATSVSGLAAQSAEELYEAKCGRCHAPYSPDSYPAEDWPGIVRSMRSQAGLTAEEQALLTEYLVQMAGGERAEEGGAEGPVLGGYMYTEYFQDQQKAKNFDLHYLAISVSGWVNDRIQYLAEFELEHGGVGGNNTFVEQAYIDFWLTQNLGVKVGGILTPFNRFDELHDPLSNFTISRPQVSRELGVSAWKEVGVVVHGFKDLSEDLSLFFDAYTINGLGDGSNLRGSRQYRDNNEDRAMGGRVNLVVKDMVEIGGSAYNGAWDDEGDYDLTMFGGFLMVRTPFADFWGEYSTAETENPSPDGEGDMSGYFFQASRLFNEKFRPTIRIGSLDYLDPGSQLGRDPGKGDKDLTEFVLSFAYYPNSKVALKAEYIFFGEGDRKEEVDNNLFGLQAALRF